MKKIIAIDKNLAYFKEYLSLVQGGMDETEAYLKVAKKMWEEWALREEMGL